MYEYLHDGFELDSIIKLIPNLFPTKSFSLSTKTLEIKNAVNYECSVKHTLTPDAIWMRNLEFTISIHLAFYCYNSKY